MALNPNAAGKKEADCTRTGDQHRDGGEVQKESSAASAAANQNGDQAGCGDGVMPDREAPERRRSVQRDARSFNTSPLPGQKPNEDVPRRNFQIPRKTRERKGLYQILAPDSREFEDLVKLISSFYLDSSSRGMFSYCKARLIHNELLEKEFIEKRREMKQEGRTDQELTESYCFLYPDKSKLQWVCEKGLSVGHARITTVGNPSSGVYLSKYSDLLQMNPFEAGTTGDMIVFKVMRGRIKHIFDNMPKNAMEPTPKFDCHLSKSASRATSLLSYRAFELTQQYFFEFAFDEIKARPRHVCPYAVVSFQYKGKETAAAPMTAHRFNTISPEGNRGKNCYTVWSGPLVNKGQELFPVCLRSSKRAYLPFRLPEKLQVNRAMQLDQVKRKLPSILFSWDTYSMSREVLKYGMFCSLFDVVDGKGKPTCGSLAALINKLERDRMVLVKSLLDRGFLFLLSSAQMLDSKERWGRVEKNLQALFIFQESRMVVKYSSRLFDSDLLTVELRPSFLPCVESFIPALHYALFKLRPNPGKDPSFGVERQATDYLTRMDLGTVRPFILPDYKHVDDRTKPLPLHRPKCNMEAALRSYIHNPANYVLPLAKAKDIIYKIQNPVPAPAPAPMEYSPVSDWGGSDRGSDRAERLLERLPQEKSLLDRTGLERMRLDSSRQRSGLAPSVGTQLQPRTQIETQAQSQRLRLSQSEYDKEKMKQLLKLIHLHKKTLVKDPGKERAEDVGAWVSRQLKRKYEGDDTGGMSKHSRTDPLSNGEPSRVAQPDEPGDEPVHSENLTEVMESMGIYDTDLRSRTNTDASSVHETQRLLKILLTTLNKAMTQGSLQVNHGEPSAGAGRSDLAVHDPDFRKQSELHLQTNYLEDMDCSPGSPVSPGSPPQQPSTSDNLMWVVRTDEDKAQIFPELKVEPKLKPKLEPNLEPKPESNPELRFESKPEAKVELDPDAKFQSNLELKPEPKAESKLEMKYEPKVKPELDSEPFVELSQEPKPEPGFEPKLELESGALIVADHQPGQQNPTLMEVEKTTGPPTVPLIEEVPPGPSISLDTILNQEIHSLTSDIKSIMQSNHIYYSSRLPLRSPLHHSWLPNCSFSDFVVPFVSSVPIQGHVKALCEKMGKLIPAPPAPVEVTSPPPPVTSSNLTTPPPAPTPMSPPAHAATPPSAPTAAPHIKAESSQSNTTVSAESHKKMRTKARAQATSSEVAGNVYSPSQITPDSPGSNSAPSTGSGLLATSLIGQLKPEVFSSLVEIFKDVTKNTVKFYIYSGDEEESTVCREIKEYLISLGNRECSPQTFLENSGSLDKLLIIIQNEDIAAHVHKIPALVSLKKLPSVSFAGVDTLDDVKNRTYNELFVSGGFIVSDEHVLNPDFITQDRLQGLLKFLEEQSTPEQPWQWKVHCKSQKKLKELGRMNTNAMGLLNLLTAFQKKHLVEFLPYHECDTQSRQAPDLECLIKLQAQYTQQRHLIFLTERPFEMFLQYSRNGIVIASIDDVMSGFHSLIGSISQNELPTPPSTGSYYQQQYYMGEKQGQ
ncbi:protein TASOR isoform X2 [Thalassophryne amazonica]|uniref:protein TASOR isoform X2 n=1 Tax=Thalassophryne amazonica TaxID=390379 RepID=UPI00147248ED|nr:protein TASOR isoform X2 [Thalassophryne amazonica]